MRILHVVPTYLPATRYGGPIYSVHGLCKALAALGEEVHVFTTNVDGESDSAVPLGSPVDLDGVKVWYFPSTRLRRLYYSPSMMAVLKDKMRGFDLVHLHSIYLWPTWAAARVAQAAGVPYVLSPRGMLVLDLVRRKSRWIKSAWLRLIEKKNIERAAAIHVTSDTEEADLGGFPYAFPPVLRIANGIAVPRDWAWEDLSSDVAEVVRGEPYLLCFGRINWKKGLDRLLRAWADVPGIRLVIAGNDEEDYVPALREIAREVGVSERVCFLDRAISGADKEALLGTARLLVLASYSENFGNVVPEAMVRGVPVVVTKEVGAKDIVRESGGGIVVDAAELASGIRSLLEDEEARMEMGRKGREWVRGHLTWECIAEQMTDSYRHILGQ